MSNPTGSTYLSANQTYIWADGDVYEIALADQWEGAADGASFGGLGVDNQPHQMLLNKIQNIYNHQLLDEANLAGLLSLLNPLTSGVGPNGWLKAGTNDALLGGIQIIWQWGTIDLTGYGEEPGTNPEEPQLPDSFPFNFPIAFPNAIWMLVPYWQTNRADTIPPRPVSVTSGFEWLALEAVSPLQLQGNRIAYGLSVTPGEELITSLDTLYGPGIKGIGWVAVGY